MIILTTVLPLSYQPVEYLRYDWGWSSDYCNTYYWKPLEGIPEIKELIEPDCYI